MTSPQERADTLLDALVHARHERDEARRERDGWASSAQTRVDERDRARREVRVLRAELLGCKAERDQLADEADAARTELDNVRGELGAATTRALDEVRAALDGWIEGVKSNCEASGHKGCDCASEFHPDDVRAMVLDAQRQLTHGGTVPVSSIVQDAVARSQIGNLAEQVATLTHERDELKRRLGEAHAELRRTLDDASTIDRLMRERDAAERKVAELRKRLEDGHVCTDACRPNAHVAFLGRAELDRVTAERDAALAQADKAASIVGSLRAALGSITDRIDSLDETEQP